jgi:hypothetical protein
MRTSLNGVLRNVQASFPKLSQPTGSTFPTDVAQAGSVLHATKELRDAYAGAEGGILSTAIQQGDFSKLTPEESADAITLIQYTALVADLEELLNAPATQFDKKRAELLERIERRPREFHAEVDRLKREIGRQGDLVKLLESPDSTAANERDGYYKDLRKAPPFQSWSEGAKRLERAIHWLDSLNRDLQRTQANLAASLRR